MFKPTDTWNRLYAQDSFVKEVVVLTEKEKAVSLEISGDYYTEQELRDMKVPEPLVVKSLELAVAFYQKDLTTHARESQGTYP